MKIPKFIITTIILVFIVFSQLPFSSFGIQNSKTQKLFFANETDSTSAENTVNFYHSVFPENDSSEIFGYNKLNNLKSSEEITQKLDSIVLESYNISTEKWERIGKQKYGTEQIGNRIQYNFYVWNDILSQWKCFPTETREFDADGRIIFQIVHSGVRTDTSYNYNSTLDRTRTYDNDGKQELRVIYHGDFSKDELVPNRKDSISYDINENLKFLISYNWDVENAEWTPFKKYESDYDEYGHRILDSEYSYDIYERKWVGAKKREFAFDKDGHKLLELVYDWDPISNQWLNSIDLKYAYNENGNIKNSVYWVWDNSTNSWQGDNKEEFYFDENGNTTELFSFKWDKTLEDWVYNGKTENTYDENSNQLISSFYTWEQTDSSWFGISKVEHRFNINSKELFRIDYRWDETENLWGEVKKETYSYDEKENLILTSLFNWDNVAYEWIFDTDKSKTEFTYNEKGEIAKRIDSAWDNDKGKWRITNRSEYTYDNEGRQVLVISSDWNEESSEWDYFSKKELSFDEVGKYTLDVEYTWDAETKDWKIKRFNEWNFDSFRNEILNANLVWLGYNYTGRKTERIYDENKNVLMLSSYNWNDNFKQWIGQSKFEKVFNPFGNLSVNLNYSWDNIGNEWQKKSRETYYYSEDIVQEVSRTVDIEENVIIYPNPASSFIVFEKGEGVNISVVELYDLSGKKVIAEKLPKNKQLSVAHLKRGIYLWKLFTESKEFTGKVIIQ